MDESLQFKTEDILSVFTDKMLPGSTYSEIVRLLEYLVGGPYRQGDMRFLVHKYHLALLRQFPWMGEVRVPENYSDTPAHLWMENVVEKYGETHSVEPLKKGEIIS